MLSSVAARSDPLPAEGTLLAIDPGERRVGLAVCDPSQSVARPLDTLAPGGLGDLLVLLEAFVGEHGSVGWVVGHPLREDGSRGAQAQRAETLAFHLRERWPDLPVALWDERWSSDQADAARAEASRPDREKGRDAAAAAVILQAFLDERASERG